VVLLWLSLVKIVMNNIIDTHFHIWDLGLRLKYQKTDGSFDWPDESLSTIHRNILADEAAREFQKSKVEAAIFVQCLNGSQEEIKWVEDLSSSYPVIKGIVGGIDLSQDPDSIRGQVRDCKILVGVRHILDVVPQNWILREDVHRGLKILMEEDKVFDCLVRPPILKHVATIASKFPKLRLVIDHISKPYMSQGEEAGLQGWMEDMTAAAQFSNVYCKLSGLVTEVDPDQYQKSWTAETFRPYVSHCLKVFGTRRCMFGSDWPVCRLANAEHGRVVTLLDEILSLCNISDEEKVNIFRENALSIYKLKV